MEAISDHDESCLSGDVDTVVPHLGNGMPEEDSNVDSFFQ